MRHICLLMLLSFSGLSLAGPSLAQSFDFSGNPVEAQAPAQNNGLSRVEIRDAGVSFLVPSNFTESRKNDSAEQTVTYNGFDGRASISINTGRLPENATLDTLEQVYAAKFLSAATLISADRPGVGDGMAIRKVYQLPLDNSQLKLITAITYVVRSGFFHVFRVSAQENLQWDQMSQISGSLTALETLPTGNMSFPARASTGPVNTPGQTYPGGTAVNPWNSTTPGIPMVINSFPQGALVNLDGREVGRTPLSLTITMPGLHRIEMLQEGYAPWIKEMQIQGDAVAMIDAYLEPGSQENWSSTPTANSGAQPRTYEYPVDMETSSPQVDETQFKRHYSYDQSSDQSVPADLTTQNPGLTSSRASQLEELYQEYEKQVLRYETQVFYQHRRIDVSRKDERRIKQLLRDISSAARELLSAQNGSSINSELLEKFSSLQKRARQIRDWAL